MDEKIELKTEEDSALLSHLNYISQYYCFTTFLIK